MGFFAVLVIVLVAVAFFMYWIFSATARHAEMRAEALAQPVRPARREPRPRRDP